MVDTSQLTELISALRAETEADSVSPEHVGYVLQQIVDKLPSTSMQLNAIKGYVVISSTSELPTSPTTEQQMKGYLLGTTLYVWVGTGGDTLDGKYQSAQLKGADGAPGEPGPKGDSGVHLGDVVLVNDLETGGEEDALSAEMGKKLNKRGSISKTYHCMVICGAHGYYNAQGDLVDGAYNHALIDITNVTRLDVTGSLSNRVVYFGADGTTKLGMTSTPIVQSSAFPSGAVYAGFSYGREKTDNVTIDYSIGEPIAEVDKGNFFVRSLVYPTCSSVVDSTTGEQSYSAEWKSIYGLIPVYGAKVISCLDGQYTKQVIAFFDESLNLINVRTYFLSASVPSGAVYARIRLGTNMTITQATVNLFYGSLEAEHELVNETNVKLRQISPMPLKGVDVAFLGDSITSPNTFGYYVTMFKQRTGANCENFGIAGQTYADGQIAAQASNLTGNEKLIIIMAGTNDFGHNCPIGNIHDVSNGTIIPTTDTTTMCGGIHQAISAIYAKCPTAKIAIVTPPQRESAWTANTQGKFLYDYVDAIKDVAKLYGIPVIDQFSNCNVPAFLAPMKAAYFANDGIHPTPHYHMLIAEWLYNGLANWIKEPFC